MSLSAGLSVWDKINGWMAPLDGMIDALLRPLVEPLAGMLDSVTGNSAELRSTAQRWRDLAATVEHLAEHHRDVVAPMAHAWDGAAHDAFQEAMRELHAHVTELAGATRETAEFLEDAAMEVELAEELVATIIRELIEWALLTLAVSAALSLVTLGATAIAGGATAAAQAAVAGSRIAAVLTRVASLLQRLAVLLQTINRMRFFTREGFLIKTLLVKGVLLKPVVSNLTGLSAAPVREGVRTGLEGAQDILADEVDDRLVGDTGLQTPLRERLGGTGQPALVPEGSPLRRPVDAIRDAAERADELIPEPPLR